MDVKVAPEVDKASISKGDAYRHPRRQNTNRNPYCRTSFLRRVLRDDIVTSCCIKKRQRCGSPVQCSWCISGAFFLAALFVFVTYFNWRDEDERNENNPPNFFVKAGMQFGIGIGVFIMLWLIVSFFRNIYYRRHYLFTIQRMLGFGICGFCCPITGLAFTLYWVKILILVLFVQEEMSLDCSLYYGNNFTNATATTSQGHLLLQAGGKCAMTKDTINRLEGRLQFQLYKGSVVTGHSCLGYKQLSFGQSAEGCMAEAIHNPDCNNLISYNKHNRTCLCDKKNEKKAANRTNLQSDPDFDRVEFVDNVYCKKNYALKTSVAKDKGWMCYNTASNSISDVACPTGCVRSSVTGAPLSCVWEEHKHIKCKGPPPHSYLNISLACPPRNGGQKLAGRTAAECKRSCDRHLYCTACWMQEGSCWANIWDHEYDVTPLNLAACSTSGTAPELYIKTRFVEIHRGNSRGCRSAEFRRRFTRFKAIGPTECKQFCLNLFAKHEKEIVPCGAYSYKPNATGEENCYAYYDKAKCSPQPRLGSSIWYTYENELTTYRTSTVAQTCITDPPEDFVNWAISKVSKDWHYTVLYLLGSFFVAIVLLLFHCCLTRLRTVVISIPSSKEQQEEAKFIAAERKVLELARSMKGNKKKPKEKGSKDQIWGCKKVYKTLRTLDEPRMFLVAGNIECDGKRIAYHQLCKEDRALLKIPSAFRRQPEFSLEDHSNVAQTHDSWYNIENNMLTIIFGAVKFAAPVFIAIFVIPMFFVLVILIPLEILMQNFKGMARCATKLAAARNFMQTAINPANTFRLFLSAEGDDTTKFINKLMSNSNNITKTDIEILKNLLGNHSYRVKLTKTATQGSLFKCGYFTCVACQETKSDKFKGFQQIRFLAERKLKQISNKWEAGVYIKGKLGQKLGNIGRGTGLQTERVRMDGPEILGSRLWAAMGFRDSKYLMGLMLLTAAVDEDFQTKSQAIAEATRGRCRSAPPKAFARMVNKLASDHLWEWDPRGASNIDMSRNGIAYDTPKDLRIGFETLTRRFPALRMKNNMRKDFDAPSKTFGYRAILVNMLYTPDPNPDGSERTWAQMFDLPSTQTAWKQLCKDLHFDENRFKKHLVTPLRRAYDRQPVRYAVESQLFLQEYLDMRKESHIWYKIYRAESVAALVQDCSRYALRREAEPHETERGKYKLTTRPRATDEIAAASEAPQFAVGTRVLGNYQAKGLLRAATITANHGDCVDLKYDNGDFESRVDFARLRFDNSKPPQNEKSENLVVPYPLSS